MNETKKYKVAVESKRYLKNNGFKKVNTEAYQYCYCPDCRCQQCKN